MGFFFTGLKDLYRETVITIEIVENGFCMVFIGFVGFLLNDSIGSPMSLWYFHLSDTLGFHDSVDV